METGQKSALMRTILDVFSAYERGVIRGRTRGALAVKKSRGERVGGVPFGFKLSDDRVHLVADEAEQVVLVELRTLRAAGHSIRAVTERLNAQGHRARGSRWHATTVARLLRAAG